MFISFGYNCSIAAYLNKFKICQIDSPFDNLITKNLKSVADLLDENFFGWFENFSITGFGPKKMHIFCEKYKTLSVHDVPNELEKKEIRNFIFEKKIKNLKKVIENIKNYDKKIVILRSNENDTTKEEIVYFYDTLMKIRKNKPIEIFIFQKINTIKLPCLNLINIDLPKYESHWHFSQEWNHVFKCIFESKIYL